MSDEMTGLQFTNAVREVAQAHAEARGFGPLWRSAPYEVTKPYLSDRAVEVFDRAARIAAGRGLEVVTAAVLFEARDALIAEYSAAEGAPHDG